MKKLDINKIPQIKADKKRWYIQPNELHEELLKSKNDGKCSDRLASMLMLLTDKMLQGYRFSGYSVELKEDMKSFALLKLMTCIDKYNPDKLKSKNAMNYVTRIVFTSYLTVLSKHYKEVNKKQKIIKNLLNQMKVKNEFEKSK